MAWGNRQKLASRAISEGDLDLAARYLKRDQFQKSMAGRRLTKQLTSALIQRAEQATSLGDLRLAWKDLSTATELVGPQGSDSISRQKNQLVEMTIESADSLLFNGKITHAVRLVDQLNQRKIMDWRADQIVQVSDCLQQAEEFAAHGKFGDSATRLEQARNLKPNLPYVEARLDAARMRESQMKKLNSELQSSALKCHWGEVNKCCLKILAIAPKHQIAIDAQRHCVTQMKRQTSSGLRATSVPDKARVTPSNSFFQVKGQPSQAGADQNGALEQPAEKIYATHSFMLWVDGVGGYLVCTEPVNTIGQAVENANVSIPVQADLRRRHARIETIGGQHLIQPLGPVDVADSPIDSSVELKHKQVISLEGGVQLRYTQSHPLSKSGRLDFVSRHRTSPWSDAILLFSQTIVLGPNRDNHVFCPTWKSDLILFERKGKWFCRAKEPFEIDGDEVAKEGEVEFNSRIVGEDYSLTLEPILIQ